MRLGSLKTVKRLNRERRTTTASGYGVGVAADNELRALQAVGVVNFRAQKILIAHGVNQKFQAVFFNFKVVVIFDFVKRKAVLEA